MEHQNQETFLTLSSYNYERFAETDSLLRLGVHIQNHKSQRRIFDFIEDNFSPLKIFYERLYKAKLYEQTTVDNKYYYLDPTDAQNKILKRAKLDQQTTLFAIFLYWLHKMEKQFSFYLTKQEIIETLYSHHRIKPHIQMLFFGSEKEDTLSVHKTLEKWVSDSLNKIAKLGWVYFSDDDEKFEFLPAFERIAEIYKEAIYDIDNIKTTSDFKNQ